MTSPTSPPPILTPKQQAWNAEKARNRAGHERHQKKSASSISRFITRHITLTPEADDSLTIACDCGVHQRIARRSLADMEERVRHFERNHRKCRP
jgi:hypothetical protein